MTRAEVTRAEVTRVTERAAVMAVAAAVVRAAVRDDPRGEHVDHDDTLLSTTLGCCPCRR